MNFIIQFFWEGEPNLAVAPFLKPLTLDLRSIEEARKMAMKAAGHKDIPVHSFTIKSENGTASERWFYLDGTWRRKDVRRSPDDR